ncbi:hypothetical protein ACOSP7_002226 [Xanthoceras sorbifolium]
MSSSSDQKRRKHKVGESEVSCLEKNNFQFVDDVIRNYEQLHIIKALARNQKVARSSKAEVTEASGPQGVRETQRKGRTRSSLFILL